MRIINPHPDGIRHRLIPTLQAHGQSWYVWGAPAALKEAERSFREEGVPILVCEAPEGGIVRQVAVVGGTTSSRRRRA